MPFNFNDSNKPNSQLLNEFSQYLTKGALFERPAAIQHPGPEWIATATIRKIDFGGYCLTYESAACNSRRDADENVCAQALEYLKFSPECLYYLAGKRIIGRPVYSFQVDGRGVVHCTITIDCPGETPTIGNGLSYGLAYEHACALVMHRLWERGVRP